MYKVILSAALLAVMTLSSVAQTTKKTTKKKAVTKKTTTTSTTTATSATATSATKTAATTTTTTTTTTDTKSSLLSSDNISNGLKEALQVGATNAAKKLGLQDGFFGNAAIKILMPPEALTIEKKLRDYGMGSQVDDAILSMNRAAESASQSAAPIFISAIKSMSITDAVKILKGTDTAATGYLREKTTPQLTTAFRPVIEQSLDQVGASTKWSALVSLYNNIPFIKKLNPDLAGYVTDKALSGMFLTVADEEKKIRKDPVAQTTDLLKKVFGL